MRCIEFNTPAVIQIDEYVEFAKKLGGNWWVQPEIGYYGSLSRDTAAIYLYEPHPSTSSNSPEELAGLARVLGGEPRTSVTVQIGSGVGSTELAAEFVDRLFERWGGCVYDDEGNFRHYHGPRSWEVWRLRPLSTWEWCSEYLVRLGDRIPIGSVLSIVECLAGKKMFKTKSDVGDEVYVLHIGDDDFRLDSVVEGDPDRISSKEYPTRLIVSTMVLDGGDSRRPYSQQFVRDFVDAAKRLHPDLSCIVLDDDGEVVDLGTVESWGREDATDVESPWN